MTNIKNARFGAGCFWGVQRKFEKLGNGIIKTTVGYSNGKDQFKNPTYKQVCSGVTDHNEVIDIEYNEDVISYKDLLRTFWSLHNPTQKDRQGPDVGRQYRSMIVYYDEEQKKLAEESKQEEQKKYSKPIATVIEPAKTFFAAEEYHQHYLDKNSGATCYI
eukprot:CAMPEP_0117448798 /NCGR_PEP_ID=MMETSP0759-20121206/7595_1 /TAXON_ID=63605 /ORGANISM="Percolomonas cosmopolitus, Strain WS" /LENGTH=160 /DNA_ID=CAMNT_0005241213 /DNA_START=168 /DNA_END=650 /DNA_ORIENTATION=-